MKIKTLVLGLLLVLSSVGSTFADGTSPLGKWKISTGESVFQIVDCGEHAICARLIWLNDDARKDAKNLVYLGHTVVNATFTGNNQWDGTMSYQGSVYKGSLTMTSPNDIKMSACSGPLCQTYAFSRVD